MVKAYMNSMSDYLREIDLNPTINGAAAPITSPLDPRAMHYFGFLSEGQEVTLVQPFGGQPRVLVSFHYGNQPTTSRASDGTAGGGPRARVGDEVAGVARP